METADLVLAALELTGQRVEKLGVGTAPIPRKKLTVDKLAQAIDRAVTDPVMRQQAAELGAKIQSEDGIANAVAVIAAIERDRAVGRSIDRAETRIRTKLLAYR
jgi:UDP:flavonoid glycosyltransferase YjiC (YdhE family)